MKIFGIFVLTFAAFLFCSTNALAQKPAPGDYYSGYGTVTVKSSTTAKKLDFSMTIETQNGCQGAIEGSAKLVRGKSVFAWEEKLSEDKNYGPNARYRLEFTVVGNKITVKESSPGASHDVTIYRGMACTFNGMYKK
jgi:hypothetical protein